MQGTIEISKEEATNIQQCIEKCFTLYMTKTEIVLTLQNQLNVSPEITQTMLENLEQTNPEFFKIYNKRLQIKEQIVEFNHLSRLQLQAMTNGGGLLNAKKNISNTTNNQVMDTRPINTTIDNTNINNNSSTAGGLGNTNTSTLNSYQHIDFTQFQTPSNNNQNNNNNSNSNNNSSTTTTTDTTHDIYNTNNHQNLTNILEDNNKNIVNNILKRNIIDQSTDVLALLRESNGGLNTRLNNTTSNNNNQLDPNDFNIGNIDFSQIPLNVSFSFALADNLKQSSTAHPNLSSTTSTHKDDDSLNKSSLNIQNDLDSYFDNK